MKSLERELENLEAEYLVLAKKKHRLERQLLLQEKAENLERKIQRKARNRRVYQKGGLVELVFGDTVDAGFLVGMLLAGKACSPEQKVNLKRQGDKKIAKFEQQKKPGKQSKTVQI
ncbi:MAG: Conjugal transfer protein TraD [Firmicutes bacterium]|nr:Conjugal transfer protein TraD [Bacillota bacterium]